MLLPTNTKSKTYSQSYHLNTQIQGKLQTHFCNRDVQANLRTPQLIPLGTQYLPHPTSTSAM